MGRNVGLRVERVRPAEAPARVRAERDVLVRGRGVVDEPPVWNRASSPTNAVEFHTVNRVQDDSTPAHVASFFNFVQSSAVQPWQLTLRPSTTKRPAAS